MSTQTPLQAVVTAKAAMDQSTTPLLLCLFKSDGTPYVPLTTANKMPVQAASVAADVAALVVDFNALLTKLKNAGLMATS
jgi:hypothetical protein